MLTKRFLLVISHSFWSVDGGRNSFEVGCSGGVFRLRSYRPTYRLSIFGQGDVLRPESNQDELLAGDGKSECLAICSLNTSEIERSIVFFKHYHYSFCHSVPPLTRCRPPVRIGLAGSQGPVTTFLYLCRLMSHHEHPPMTNAVPSPPIMSPKSDLEMTCQIQPQQNPQVP